MNKTLVFIKQSDEMPAANHVYEHALIRSFHKEMAKNHGLSYQYNLQGRSYESGTIFLELNTDNPSILTAFGSFIRDVTSEKIEAEIPTALIESQYEYGIKLDAGHDLSELAIRAHNDYPWTDAREASLFDATESQELMDFPKSTPKRYPKRRIRLPFKNLNSHEVAIATWLEDFIINDFHNALSLEIAIYDYKHSIFERSARGRSTYQELNFITEVPATALAEHIRTRLEHIREHVGNISEMLRGRYDQQDFEYHAERTFNNSGVIIGPRELKLATSPESIGKVLSSIEVTVR